MCGRSLGKACRSLDGIGDGGGQVLCGIEGQFRLCLIRGSATRFGGGPGQRCGLGDLGRIDGRRQDLKRLLHRRGGGRGAGGRVVAFQRLVGAFQIGNRVQNGLRRPLRGLFRVGAGPAGSGGGAHGRVTQADEGLLFGLARPGTQAQSLGCAGGGASSGAGLCHGCGGGLRKGLVHRHGALLGRLERIRACRPIGFQGCIFQNRVDKILQRSDVLGRRTFAQGKQFGHGLVQGRDGQLGLLGLFVIHAARPCSEAQSLGPGRKRRRSRSGLCRRRALGRVGKGAGQDISGLGAIKPAGKRPRGTGRGRIGAIGCDLGGFLGRAARHVRGPGGATALVDFLAEFL